MNESDFALVEGSGNVFRDFDGPHADLKQAKAILAAQIIAVLDEHTLTVRKAAGMTGFAVTDFSRVRNADLGRFTLDRLMKTLAALDGRIRVTLQIDPWRAREVPCRALVDRCHGADGPKNRAAACPRLAVARAGNPPPGPRADRSGQPGTGFPSLQFRSIAPDRPYKWLS